MSDAIMPGPVGFVGLGAMGKPIALRLAAAVGRLIVSDQVAARVTEVVAAEPGAVDDGRALQEAQTIFLCLPSPQATRSVVETLLAQSDIPRLFIDFGAYQPDFVATLSTLCEVSSSTYCDCPVFGTPGMADRGNLYFLFSGPVAAAEAFDHLARQAGFRVRYAGPSGKASTVKLLQNALGTANLAIGAEVLRVCEAIGIETERFIEIVGECGGIGQSTVFDRFAADMAARRDSGEGRLRIAAKDMKSVAALASSCEVSAPMLDAATHYYEAAMNEGLGEQQFTEIISLGKRRRIEPK